MTNEEKANEIGTIIWEEWKDATLATGAEKGAILMAEWKDQQIQEIIDKEIDRANRYHDGNLSLAQKAASVRVVSVLSEYLGKEFPKDRFHFGFITLD